MADHIYLATGHAWALPRFEAADFAAAYVRANKAGGGDIYFSKGPNRHGDLDYRYIVTWKAGAIRVDAIRRVDGPEGAQVDGSRLLDLTISELGKCSL